MDPLSMLYVTLVVTMNPYMYPHWASIISMRLNCVLWRLHAKETLPFFELKSHLQTSIIFILEQEIVVSKRINL